MADGDVRVAIVDDFDVVVAGVARMLAGHDGIAVVDLAAGEPVEVDVDVALVDTFGMGEADAAALDVLLRHDRAERVAIYTWRVGPALVDVARRRGVTGYLSKQLSADELADAVRRIGAGERVYALGDGAHADAVPRPAVTARSWPGQEHGLTEREAEVVTHIVAGRNNAEIAELLHLSPNSVKTHVRNAYRRIGVERRPQAVLWGIDHGLRAPHARFDDWRASATP